MCCFWLQQMAYSGSLPCRCRYLIAQNARTMCACMRCCTGWLIDGSNTFATLAWLLVPSQLIGRCPVCALSDCTGNTWGCVPCSCTSPAVRKRVSWQTASGTRGTGILWRRYVTATPKQILFGLHFCARARMASPAGQQLCESVLHFQHDGASLVGSRQGCNRNCLLCLLPDVDCATFLDSEQQQSI
jgi:hypothetical protein